MNRVQEIRKERNITQVQLAKYAGISRKYLSNVENQLANPSVDVAFRISTALSVDIDKIFFDVPKPNITVYPKPLRYIDLFCGIGGFRYASKGAFDNRHDNLIHLLMFLILFEVSYRHHGLPNSLHFPVQKLAVVFLL